MTDIADHAQSVEAAERHGALAAMCRAREQEMRRGCAADCENCGDPISLARQQAVPGVQLCVDCQSRQEWLQRGGRG